MECALCDVETQTDVIEAPVLESLHLPVPVPSPNSSLSPDVTHRTSGIYQESLLTFAHSLLIFLSLLSVCLSVCLSLCVSVCLSFCLSVCLSVSLSLHPCLVSVSLSLSLSLSISLSFSLDSYFRLFLKRCILHVTRHLFPFP